MCDVFSLTGACHQWEVKHESWTKVETLVLCVKFGVKKKDFKCVLQFHILGTALHAHRKNKFTFWEKIHSITFIGKSLVTRSLSLSASSWLV